MATFFIRWGALQGNRYDIAAAASPPGIKGAARRASACPSPRAGALVTLVHSLGQSAAVGTIKRNG